MGRKTITITITVFWLTMMGLLVNRNLRMQQQRITKTGYSSILRPKFLEQEKQMGIYLGGERIGMTRTTYLQTGGGYDIESFSRLQMSILGSRPSSVRIKMSIGADFRLQDLKGTLAIPVLDSGSIDIAGKVVGDELHVKLIRQSGEIVGETKMPFKNDEVLANIISPFDIMPELELGKTWTYRMFNPLSQSFEEAEALVSRLDHIVVDKVGYDVFVVNISVGNLGTTTAFITPEREIIKQQVGSLGLELVVEKPGFGWADKEPAKAVEAPAPVEDSPVAPSVPPEDL